jgi:hypothetical protein
MYIDIHQKYCIYLSLYIYLYIDIYMSIYRYRYLQLVHRTAPVAAEYVPVPQSVQSADPVDALYLPATHAVHVPPSGPENPALQDMHAVKEVLPTGALEVSAVKSTPRTMRSAITEVASVLRYSSTTKTPAMSPFK